MGALRILAAMLCLAAAGGAAADGVAPSGRRGIASSEFVIGAAGAPVSLFGSADAPRFSEVFTDLQHHGFNVFFPCFITRETSEGVSSSGHDAFFFDMDGTSPTYCAGRHSPYRAAHGRLRILFPAFIFVPSEQWSTDVDTRELRRVLTRFLDQCLHGDASVIAGFENFDEPASQYVVGIFAPDEAPPVGLHNVARVARTVRSVFRGLPVYVVEGALPFVIDRDPGAAAIREQIDEAFRRGVDGTAPSADWYGFDIYPVPLTTDLAVVGDYVRRAQEYAPRKRIVSVIQGFGGEDLGRDGRRPTPTENRFMAYSSAINGADGIIWWGQSAMDISRSSELWESIKATGREIRRIAPLLSLRTVAVKCDSPEIDLLAKADGRSTYVIAANSSPEAQTVSLHVPLAHVEDTAPECRVTDFLSGARLKASVLDGDTVVSDQFGPYGVRVYAVTCR